MLKTNTFAFVIYCEVHFYDQLLAAVFRFVDSTKSFQKKANAFNGETTDTKYPEKFKAAASAFSEAGKRFKELGIVIYKISEKSYICSIFKYHLNKLTTAASTFQSQAGLFKSAADNITNSVVLTRPNVTAAITAFQKAADNFGKTGSGTDVSATKKFLEFATELEKASCSNLTDLQNKAKAFANEAERFADKAKAFHDAARQVKDNDKTDLGNIKEPFKAAADRFSTAVDALYNAIKDV